MATKEIYFAGGCFWGTEHFFSGVDGVVSAVSGYAQGSSEFDGRPSYEQVYTDTTGFAETVRVSYRPERISLATLADLYFSIIDPLSLNRQGHDEGTRYRTGIYYSDSSDRPVLEDAFAIVEARLGQSLAVELEPLRNFFEAEERHQKYLDKNPDGYCHLPARVFKYLRLYQDVAALLGDEPDPVARMAETAALIYERMKFFWVGFYIVRDQELVLGPFQGPPACLRIGYGRGVCGTAWKEARTVVVPDVEAFPGHIACSSLSRSEIVVPVFREGLFGRAMPVLAAPCGPQTGPLPVADSLAAVLDIDSTTLATFDATDALWLEKICRLL
ncbi:MAG: peptide-methionine (S)-S-oxide reductase MsrA [Bacteroidales bacterium]|nr:peptide-methionine (S)-S-oxide reductase MsrA [Bacteroidales bacterium]